MSGPRDEAIRENPILNTCETLFIVPPKDCITRTKLAKEPISLNTTPVNTRPIPDTVDNTIPHFRIAGCVLLNEIIDLANLLAHLTTLVKGLIIVSSALPIVLPSEANSSSGNFIIMSANSKKLSFSFLNTPPSLATE